MKISLYLIALISLVAFSGIVLAFKGYRINYVFVPASGGPTGVCTSFLLDYTATDNGNLLTFRTASSIPITVGCRQISIYPVTPIE